MTSVAWEFFSVIGLDIQIKPHQLFLGGKKKIVEMSHYREMVPRGEKALLSTQAFPHSFKLKRFQMRPILQEQSPPNFTGSPGHIKAAAF